MCVCTRTTFKPQTRTWRFFFTCFKKNYFSVYKKGSLWWVLCSRNFQNTMPCNNAYKLEKDWSLKWVMMMTVTGFPVYRAGDAAQVVDWSTKHGQALGWNLSINQECWPQTTNPAFKRWRWEDHRFKIIPGCTVILKLGLGYMRLCLKNRRK